MAAKGKFYLQHGDGAVGLRGQHVHLEEEKSQQVSLLCDCMMYAESLLLINDKWFTN